MARDSPANGCTMGFSDGPALAVGEFRRGDV